MPSYLWLRYMRLQVGRTELELALTVTRTQALGVPQAFELTPNPNPNRSPNSTPNPTPNPNQVGLTELERAREVAERA